MDPLGPETRQLVPYGMQHAHYPISSVIIIGLFKKFINEKHFCLGVYKIFVICFVYEKQRINLHVEDSSYYYSWNKREVPKPQRASAAILGPRDNIMYYIPVLFSTT